MTRVALLGYGLAGRVLHRPLLLAEPRLSVTHVVTGDPVRRAQVRQDLPEAALCASADELWTRAAEFDAVVVATGGPTHGPLARAALRLGKAVVVDKPLAPTADEAASLLDEGGLLTVFQNRRWDSDTLTAADLLVGGTLGEVGRLESRFTRFRPLVADRWREDPAAGGGVLLDLGSHVVDQALPLLGPVVDVYAELDVRRAGGAAEDDVFIALTHASGARSHLWCSMTSPWQGPRLVLQGAAGGWSKQGLDGQEQAMRDGTTTAPEPDGLRWDTSGAHPVRSLPGDWQAFYRRFAAAVAGDGPLPVEPADAVRTLRLLEAARRSAADRQVIVV